jgi:hypothetical protein
LAIRCVLSLRARYAATTRFRHYARRRPLFPDVGVPPHIAAALPIPMQAADIKTI